MCAIGPPNDVSPSFRNAAKTSAGVPRRLRDVSFSRARSTAPTASRSCISRASRDERNAFAAQREPPPFGVRDDDADRFLHRVAAAPLCAELDRARRAAKLEAHFREFALFVAQADAVVF